MDLKNRISSIIEQSTRIFFYLTFGQNSVFLRLLYFFFLGIFPQIKAVQAPISIQERKTLAFEKPAKNLEDMRSTYNPGFAFRQWVVEFTKNSGAFAPFAEQTKIYITRQEYDRILGMGKDVESVLASLLIEREPCTLGNSIAKWESKTKNAMTMTFPWKEAYYRRFFKENSKVLAPNVAFYCRTPLVLDGTYSSSSPTIQLLNVIGYSFHKPEDDDYQYFVRRNNHEEELKKRYKGIFYMVFNCAIERKVKRIILAKFGLDSFSTKYPGGKKALEEKVWIKAFEEVLYELDHQLAEAGIEQIGFMGDFNESDKNRYRNIIARCIKICSSSTDPQMCGVYPSSLFSSYFYGRIPKLLKKQNQAFWDKTLFLNAWDSYSMPGNGNGRDGSLDGAWGDITAISALGWPLSNPKLLGNSFIVDRDNQGKVSQKSLCDANLEDQNLLDQGDQSMGPKPHQPNKEKEWSTTFIVMLTFAIIGVLLIFTCYLVMGKPSQNRKKLKLITHDSSLVAVSIPK